MKTCSTKSNYNHNSFKQFKSIIMEIVKAQTTIQQSSDDANFSTSIYVGT